MSDSQPTIGKTAPGLIWRRRKDGWVAVWLCRTDIADKGFTPRTVPLWHGLDLTDDDRNYISDQCHRLQAEMLVFGKEGYTKADQYDGTLEGLSEAYQTDKDSNFTALRYQTRVYYTTLLRLILADHGEEDLRNIRARDIKSWHAKWTEGGTSIAHAKIGMLRTLVNFGFTYLECDECERLSAVLHGMRFKMAKPRTERLTAEQAMAIRALARASGLLSIALAQAFQFDCTFRQKDCIGEWVPISEPGVSDTMAHGKKWLRGVRWEEIDQNLILRHTTSKRQKDIEIDLSLAPMVLEELGTTDRSLLPASGPIVVCEHNGRPWRTVAFRSQWRKLANACGVPKTVKNMDSRAGAISEATDAGAPLEDVRHAATHSNITTTQNYSRGSAGKVANVMRLRRDFRGKNEA